MTIETRTLTREELPAAERSFALAMNFALPADEAESAAFRDSMDPARVHAAFDTERDESERIVGTAASYSRVIGVPGGMTSFAAVTDVGVARTYRRRGIVSRLMTDLLDGVAAAAEPIAGLYATEATIYGRFGYAAAVPRVDLAVDLSRAAFGAAGLAALAAFDGTLTDHPVDTVAAQMESVVRSVAATRPGVMTRPALHGRRVNADLASGRDGYTALRVTLARDAAGVVVGFARYAAKLSWAHHVADGVLVVHELMATTLAAEAALWRSMLDTDLCVTLRAPRRPGVDVLARLLADPRRAHPTSADGLWLRILDVPAALSQRRFSAPIDLVLDVTDAWRPAGAGRWRVQAAADGFAEVSATTQAADLALPVTALAAAHLGTVTLYDVAAAGGVTELTPGSLVAASRAWAWHVPAWSPEAF